MTLTGTVSLVTGGGSGLGREFACALARAGARVAVLGRSRESLEGTVDLIRKKGGTALSVPGDVADTSSVDQAVTTVRDTWGSITLLVNNAGTVEPIGPDWEVSPEAWWRTLEVNLRGAFNVAQAVVADMVERGAGRVVNVSSSAGHNLQPFHTAYGTSKAALSYWTASLAQALEPHGVVAIAYAPGFVHTPMTEFLGGAPSSRRWLGDGIGRALAEGRVTSVDRATQLLVDIARGRFDALSGRHIDARDDEVELLDNAETIRSRDLYVLRRSTLEPGE